MLWNLDSKLSHPSKSQRQDLKKLLLEFEHLFPDVPTRRDQIYHHIDIGNADPTKQHPYRLNPSKQKYLKEGILSICSRTTSSSQVTVIGVLPVYLFLNQMGVQTIER